jgi:hypothetical protein
MGTVFKIAISLFIAIFFAINLLGFSSKKDFHEPCINIFYDQFETHKGFEDSKFSLLIAHFQKWSQFKQNVIPVERYGAGDLDICDFNIYLGSSDGKQLPQDFIKDLSQTQSQVVWIGNNIWQLGDRLEKVLGIKYVGKTRWDSGFATSKRRPFYASQILYAGRKYYRSPLEGEPYADRNLRYFDKIELLPINRDNFQVLAESRHGITKELLPYIVRARNIYYVADLPEVFLKSEIASQFLLHIIEGFKPIDD